MRNNASNINIGKVYFWYLFGVLFLQIIGFNSKGSSLDTLWKAGTIGVTVLYFFTKTHIRIPNFILAPVLFYVIGQLLARVLYPKMLPENVFSNQLIGILIIVAMIYMFICVPRITMNIEIDNVVYFLDAFIILMLYATIYNAIKYSNAVFNFASVRNAYSDMMSSFFDNKQTFGMFVMMAMMCSVLRYVMTLKKKYLMMFLLFAFHVVICLSRTAMVAAIVFLFLVAVLLRQYKVFSWGIVLGIIAAVVLMNVNSSLNHYISNVVLFGTDTTMGVRTSIWTEGLKALTGFQLWFGYGEGSTTTILRYFAGATYSHNGIVQVLITGGIIKLILYIIILVNGIRTIRRIRYAYPVESKVLFSSFVGIFLYSMGESIVLFDSSAPCVAATIICIGLPTCLEQCAMYGDNQIEGE